MDFKSYIAKRLRELGIDQVFGLPGSYIMPIWESIGDKIPIILAKHEGNAVYMAEGWARAKGNVGVVLTTIGPGISNCITGIASAYKDSVPLLIISGQSVTEQLGKGVFQDSSGVERSFHSIELTKGITKSSVEITSKESAIDIFEQVLSLAISGREGPVHLSIPLDIQNSEVAISEKRSEQINIPNLYSDIESVKQKVDSASHPLFIIGGGCKNCSEVDDFISESSIPCISTVKGQLAVGLNNKCFIGSFGIGSLFEVENFLNDYIPDLVLVLGASMASYYMHPLQSYIKKAYVIQIDISKEQIGIYNPDDINLGIVSSVEEFIYQWRQKKINCSEPKECEGVVTKYKKIVCSQQEKMAKKSTRASVIYSLNKLLSKNTLVIPDAGNHWLDTISLYQPKEPLCFLANTGLGGMGYAIVTSIGYQLADNKRRVVCITGDGSFLMTGSEFSTAIQYKVPVIYILFNDAALGRVHTFQKKFQKGKFISSDLPQISYCGIAKAMNADAYTVSDLGEFEQCLKWALKKTDRPVLIEVMVSKNQDPVSLM